MERMAKSVGTHDGSFHADEVTACALLALHGLIDEERIIRTRNPEILEHCEYVCDVGGEYNPTHKRFDHHQSEYRGDLSSAGMVLLYLRDCGLVTKEEYTYFNDQLIKGVDAHDNGKGYHEVGYCSFSHVITNFNPPEYNISPEEQMKAFREAFTFALGHLKRLKSRLAYFESCRETIAAIMEKGEEVLIFNEAMPWQEMFFSMGGEQHPALFIIMPSGPHWKLRGVPPSLKERMQVRMPLPQQWAGRANDELTKVTGIEGAIFCHKGRFVSVWKTKEDALKALGLVLHREVKQR